MIPGFPQIGGMELIILLSVILLFFGAKRIPELARSLGKGTREFRKGISEAANEEAREDRKKEDAQKPPVDEATADSKPLHAEAEATHAEQKS